MPTRFARAIVTALLSAGLAVFGAGPGLAATAGIPAPSGAAVTGCPTTEAALQADITSAGPGGTVSFTCATATTIPFDSADGGTGMITVGQDLTLDASQAAAAVTFDGGGATQLFTVASGVTLTLAGLTVQHGLAPVTQTATGQYVAQGGAIVNNGTLDVTGSTLSGSTVPGRLVNSQYPLGLAVPNQGGAIYSTGTLIITNSTLSGNTVFGYGGGNRPGLVATGGGAIYSLGGPVTIDNTTLSGNAAGTNANTGNYQDDVGGEGGAVALAGGSLSVTGSTLTGNIAYASSNPIQGYGGAIYTGEALDGSVPAATVTVSGSTFSGNAAPGDLSGEADDLAIGALGSAALSISDSRFTANAGATGTGSVDMAGTGGLSVSGSSFSGYSGFGAIACESVCGPTTITTSTFINNTRTGWDAFGTAPDQGGGAFSSSGGAQITGSTFTGNTGTSPNNAAEPTAGAIGIGGGTITGSTFTSNTSTQSNPSGCTAICGGAEGGAIYNAGGLTVTGSTFTGNSASGNPIYTSGGGAIFNSGTLQLDHSTLSGNSGSGDATDEFGGGGGAILNLGTLTVSHSTLSGNKATNDGGGAGDGGAIFNEGTATITASTLSGNSAAGILGQQAGGGAVFTDALGSTGSHTLTVTNSTLSGNTAPASGGGGSAVYAYGGAIVSLAASTVAQGTGNGALFDDPSWQNSWTVGQTVFAANGSVCDSQSSNLGFQGSMTDTGYNLTDTGFCWGPLPSSDTTGTGPQLDPSGLQDNGVSGGPQTIALEPGSPAIDAIPVSSGLCQPTDERGNTRPDGTGETACDIGAYESAYVPVTATSTTITSSANPSASGQQVTFTATVSPQQGTATPTGTVQFAIDGANAGGPVTLDSGGQATYPASSLSVTTGTNHTVTAVYTPADTTFAASSGSLPGGQEVDKASTTTTLTSSASPSVRGQQVTFTATIGVTSPGAGPVTGTVTFTDGATTLGTGTVSTSGGVSTATYTTSGLGIGAHQITASYGGSGTLNGSISATLAQNVAYAVKLLYKAPLSGKAGTNFSIKLALEAYVNGTLKNVSSSSTPVTALCVAQSTATTCASPVISLNAPFTYSSALDNGAGGYQFNVKTPKTLAKGTYILLFRAAGEPQAIYHADAGATFTVIS